MAAVTSVFTLFSPDIVQYVCDPRCGLPKTHKWPPTLSEVHDACNARIAELERARRFKNWGHNDPGEERERLKDQGLLPAPTATKPTREQIEAKYGKGWGIGGVMPTDMQLRNFAKTLPVGSSWTLKEMIEKWRSSKGLEAGSPQPPPETGPRARTKQEFCDHPAIGETLRAFAMTLPDDGSKYLMTELCAMWRAQEDGRPVDPLQEPRSAIDPAMAALGDGGPAAPIIIDGVEVDQGADF